MMLRGGLELHKWLGRRDSELYKYAVPLRDRRLHDTRHTYASTLLSNGTSPVCVKEQLGHASIQMTVDIYGHLIPSSNRVTVNRLDSQQLSATLAQSKK
jgi:integrase